jgi:hypothetical protein
MEEPGEGLVLLEDRGKVGHIDRILSLWEWSVGFNGTNESEGVPDCSFIIFCFRHTCLCARQFNLWHRLEQ